MPETPVHIEDIVDDADGLVRKVEFKPDEEGGFHISVPSLEKCHAQGDNLTDARKEAKDAMQVWHRSVSGDISEGM